MPQGLVIRLGWENILAVHQKKTFNPSNTKHLHVWLSTYIDSNWRRLLIYPSYICIQREDQSLKWIPVIPLVIAFPCQEILWTMGVIISQNRGVKITILARQFWMAKLSIPKCSLLNVIMFSSNNHPFESNIDHFMAK